MTEKTIWEQKVKPKHFLYGLLGGAIIGALWALVESFFYSGVKTVLGIIVIAAMVGILIRSIFQLIKHYNQNIKKSENKKN